MVSAVRARLVVVLAVTVALAFAVRLSLGVPQLRTSWFSVHGIPIYAGWSYNLAENGRWEFTEQNMAGAIYAAMQESPHQRLVDPAEVVAQHGAPEPAATSAFTTFQPGHSAFMALVWGLTRDYRFVVIMVAQALLDALACLLAFRLSARIWGRGVGVVGALAYALFLPQAWIAAAPLYTALIGPLLLVVATLASVFPSGWRRQLAHAAATGASVGAGVMIAASATMLALPVSALALWRLGVRRGMIWIGVAALVGGVVLAPWSYRSWVIGNGFRPVASATWYNLHWGLIEQRDSPFGDDAAYGWPRQEELMTRHFQKTRGIDQRFTGSAEAAFRDAVLGYVADRPDYVGAIVASRFAAVVVMSGTNERIDQSLYTLSADATLHVEQSIACYRLIVEDPASLGPNRCDAEYLELNPWPGPTRKILEWLVWINHPLRIRVDGIGVYHFSGDASLGLPLLALLGYVLGWRRSPTAAAAFAFVPLAWTMAYAINHLDPRYVAGAQALFWVAACCGAASALTLLARQPAVSRIGDRALSHIR
jgi:hypothetical protein